MRILVAEDETIIRLDLRELLEKAGFEVCGEAASADASAELWASEEEAREARRRRASGVPVRSLKLRRHWRQR